MLAPVQARVFSRTKMRDLRRAQGLSVMDFAIGVGRSWATVQQYFSGRLTPPTELLPMLAVRLGCSIDDLFEPPEGGDDA